MFLTFIGDDDSNSESTSGCSSLVPHPDHSRRENHEIDVPIAVEPLNIDQSSLKKLGESLSKSLAADLKNSRGRKTLNLHSFIQDSSIVSVDEDSRYNRDLGNKTLYLEILSLLCCVTRFVSEGASVSSVFGREDTSLNQSSNKRESLQPQSCYGSKRPRFNITSFGPTAVVSIIFSVSRTFNLMFHRNDRFILLLFQEARKSLLGESIVDSPFYAGRTTYGGASAYRRATLQPSVTPFPYVRKRVQARPSSITSAPATPSSGVAPAASASNVVLSSSAQRILQALEAMSTPVRDAKRIPTATSSRKPSTIEEEPSFSGASLIFLKFL